MASGFGRLVGLEVGVHVRVKCVRNIGVSGCLVVVGGWAVEVWAVCSGVVEVWIGMSFWLSLCWLVVGEV